MNDASDPDALERPRAEEAVRDGVASTAGVARFLGRVGDGDRHARRLAREDLHAADGATVPEHLSPEAFCKTIRLRDGDLCTDALAELDGDMRPTSPIKTSLVGEQASAPRLMQDRHGLFRSWC